MKASGGWLARLKGGSLQRKMTVLLVIVVLQSVLFTGLIAGMGSVYLTGFNAIMDDCYAINQLLAAYTNEMDTLRAYVLGRGESAYAEYLQSRARTSRALDDVNIAYADSPDQYLLLQSTRASLATLRTACDDTVLRLVGGGDYADRYDRALRIDQYIEGYIRTLLHEAIGQGQTLYQRNMLRFRVLPPLLVVSILLSLCGLIIWTRWMLRRVVRPINQLIEVTGELRGGHFDAPDLFVGAEDEIAELSRMVNEMKHSTAHLVDSLRERQEIESRLHTEEMRRVKIESTMDTLRLSLLQSQINPHFLFNTLNIISRMAQMEDAPKTEELIVRLSSLFRYNLKSVDDIVPLTDELKIVGDYIAIQQIRFGERIDFVLDCRVDAARVTVPIFTMQPIIENAVIHGISPMEDGGRVTVTIAQDAGALVIRVEDTGVGMSQDQVDALLAGTATARRHVTGLGIGNVRGRILAHYPQSTFAIDSGPGSGTRVTITIAGEEAKHG